MGGSLAEEEEGDLASIERGDGDEIDHVPPEVDPDEVVEEVDEFRVGFEDPEVLGLGEGGAEEDGGGEVEAVGWAGDEAEGGDTGEEEGEASGWASEDGPEVRGALEAGSFVGGEAAHGPEDDGARAAAEAGADPGVTEFMDENGEGGDEAEDGQVGEGVTVDGLVTCAQEDQNKPEEGVDDDIKAKEAEAKHVGR